jgi:hypothetical protein
MEKANTNGYSVIRILQDDVYYNKYDWKKYLIETIDKFKTNIDNNEIKVENIYLCKKNEYKIYENLE